MVVARDAVVSAVLVEGLASRMFEGLVTALQGAAHWC